MQKLLLLALLFLAFARLKCVEECEGPEVALKISQTETAHIDNRGAEAVVLAPGANGFLSAYGFRLSTFVAVRNQADTAGVECPYFVLSPAATDCRIFTLTGLGDHPPGTDVSDLFRFADRSRSPLRYQATVDAAPAISGIWSFYQATDFDFLLVQPPVMAGWQQFELRLSQSDTTILSVTTDSIFLQ